MLNIKKRIKEKIVNFSFISSLIRKSVSDLITKEMEYATLSYSQDGEDLLLDSFINEKKQGFYIDIGAHHPKRFSNTFFFYKKGWHGINIDAMPGSMELFDQFRPNDINLELGISGINDKLTYYMFNEPALNSFDSNLSESRQNEQFKIIDKIDIEVYSLSEILDKYLPNNTKIDFLTIDVEGLELDIFKTNNWKKYKPAYILAEELNEDSKEMTYYLESIGYECISRTLRTRIFREIKGTSK